MPFDAISATRQATPLTRELSQDINAIQADLRRLQAIRDNLKPGIVIMGPGPLGRAAVNAFDVDARLGSIIRDYQDAIADLCDQHLEADIAETMAGMFKATRKARAEYRRYLRDLIIAYRNDVGTRRAA